MAMVLGAALGGALPETASAQLAPASHVNDGALTFAGGLDVPTLYIFRGIVQEGAPKLTLAPYGDVGLRLTSGERPVGSVRINVGVWHSLNTGSSGTGGPLRALHYAEQFYATLTLGLPKGLTLTPGYLANSSPNRSYDTVQEMNVRLARPGRIAPYAFVAFELSRTGQLDGGSTKGTYLELGASPSVTLPVARARLTLPVRAGWSLKNYYELLDSNLTYHDNRFGFFDLGGRITVPLSSVGSRLGVWNIHGGVEALTLGATPRAFNRGEKTKVVATVGVGVTY